MKICTKVYYKLVQLLLSQLSIFIRIKFCTKWLVPFSRDDKFKTFHVFFIKCLHKFISINNVIHSNKVLTLKILSLFYAYECQNKDNPTINIDLESLKL